MATQYVDLSMPDLCRAYKQKLVEVLEDETAQAAIDEMETEFQARGVSYPYVGQIDRTPYLGTDDEIAVRTELSLEQQLQVLKKDTERLMFDLENPPVVAAAEEDSTVDETMIEIPDPDNLPERAS